MKYYSSRSKRFIGALCLFLAAGISGCDSGSDSTGSPSAQASGGGDSAEGRFAVLNQAFRIDISYIDVVYDIDPNADEAFGRSVMDFTMRPGQSKPVFHFNPMMSVFSGFLQFEDGDHNGLSAVTLNGERLPFSAIKEITMTGSNEPVFEIDRKLSASDSHRLEFEWSIWNWFPVWSEPGEFKTNVSDITGSGNEALWPTINSPEELARHTVTFRISSDDDYVAVGSGGVTKEVFGGVQEFSIDTGRQVSSYTVMLAAMPRDKVEYYSFDVDGVRVSMMSTVGVDESNRAMGVTSQTLRDLKSSFGPLAQPSVDIFLVDWNSGMEYFAATNTGVFALKHELVHLYWGTAAVNAAWRDTWLDEAINVWWCDRVAPINDDFRSGIVGDRGPLRKGYDTRAYNEGARIIGAVEASLGAEQMDVFLREVYEQRQFKPFTTDEFVADLVEFSGDSAWVEKFNAWVGKSRW